MTATTMTMETKAMTTAAWGEHGVGVGSSVAAA
jgi:hypothetical protein